MTDQKKAPGRPKNPKVSERLTVRLDPSIHEHILAQPAGPRRYIEHLVADDRAIGASQGGTAAKQVGEEPPSIPILKPYETTRSDELWFWWSLAPKRRDPDKPTADLLGKVRKTLKELSGKALDDFDPFNGWSSLDEAWRARSLQDVRVSNGDRRIASDNLDCWPAEGRRYLILRKSELVMHDYQRFPEKGQVHSDLLYAAFFLADCLDPNLDLLFSSRSRLQVAEAETSREAAFDKWVGANWEQLDLDNPAECEARFLESGAYSPEVAAAKMSETVGQVAAELSSLGLEIATVTELDREIGNRLWAQERRFAEFVQVYGPLGMFRPVSSGREALYCEILGDYLLIAKHLAWALDSWRILSRKPWTRARSDFDSDRAQAEQILMASGDEPTSENFELALKRDVTKYLDGYLADQWKPGLPKFDIRLDWQGRLQNFPLNLLFAIWDQICRDLSAETKIGRCAQCGNWFASRGRQQSGKTMQLCSRQCNNRKYNRGTRREAAANAPGTRGRASQRDTG